MYNKNRFHYLFACVLLIGLSISNVHGQETDKKFNIMADYGLINLPFPSSHGLEATYFVSKGMAVGLDYQRSTVPLDFYFFKIGDVTETNILLQTRMYPGKHFNFLLGFGKRKTSINLPTSYFDLLTGNTVPASAFEANILRLGLGHKWTVKNKYRIAIDWLHLDIPVSARTTVSAVGLADPEDAENVRRAEDIMQWYPSGVLAQFKVGLAF